MVRNNDNNLSYLILLTKSNVDMKSPMNAYSREGNEPKTDLNNQKYHD